MMDGLVEYAKSNCGPTFSRGSDIFPVLEPEKDNDHLYSRLVY